MYSIAQPNRSFSCHPVICSKQLRYCIIQIRKPLDNYHPKQVLSNLQEKEWLSFHLLTEHTKCILWKKCIRYLVLQSWGILTWITSQPTLYPSFPSIDVILTGSRSTPSLASHFITRSQCDLPIGPKAFPMRKRTDQADHYFGRPIRNQPMKARLINRVHVALMLALDHLHTERKCGWAFGDERTYRSMWTEKTHALSIPFSFRLQWLPFYPFL